MYTKNSGVFLTWRNVVAAGVPKVNTPANEPFRSPNDVWNVNNSQEWAHQAWVEGIDVFWPFFCFLVLLFIFVVFYLSRKYFSRGESNASSSDQTFLGLFATTVFVLLNLPFNLPDYFPKTGYFFYNFLFNEYSPIFAYANHLVVFIKTYVAVVAIGLLSNYFLFCWKKWGKPFLLSWLGKLGVSTPGTPVKLVAEPKINSSFFSLPLFIAWVVTLTRVNTPLVFLAGTLFFWCIFSWGVTVQKNPEIYADFLLHLQQVFQSKKFNDLNKVVQIIYRYRGWQVWFIGPIVRNTFFVPTLLTFIGSFLYNWMLLLPIYIFNPNVMIETYSGQVVWLLGGFLSLFLSNFFSLLLVTAEWVPSSFYRIYDREKVYKIVGNPGSTLTSAAQRLALGCSLMATGVTGVYVYHEHQHQKAVQIVHDHNLFLQDFNKTVPAGQKVAPVTFYDYFHGTECLPRNAFRRGGPLANVVTFGGESTHNHNYDLPLKKSTHLSATETARHYIAEKQE